MRDKRYLIAALIMFVLSALIIMGMINAHGTVLLEKEWRFVDLTPANLTGEKAIHILPYVGGHNNDDLQISTGSSAGQVPGL